MKRLKSFRTIVLIGLVMSMLFLGMLWSYFAAVHHEQLDREMLMSLQMSEVEEVRSLIEQGADPNARDLSEVKPEGFFQQIRHIIMHSRSPQAEQAPTALSYAARAMPTPGGVMTYDSRVPSDLIRLLLDKGADVKADMRCEHPALFCVIEHGDIATVKLLLDHGADANARAHDGRTALRIGIGTGDQVLVKLLLKYHAQIQMQKDNNGLNDLDEASSLVHTLPDYASHYRQILVILNNASKTN